MYKRDETNKKRQISGTRAYVSEAKAFKFTRGFGARGRPSHNNQTYGNNRGREYRRPNDYVRNPVNRRPLPVNKNQYEEDRAKEMQRLINIAGEHARDKRSYNRPPNEYPESDISFNDNRSGYSVGSNAIQDFDRQSQQESTGNINPEGQDEENTMDSLELDDIIQLEKITVETDNEMLPGDENEENAVAANN